MRTIAHQWLSLAIVAMGIATFQTAEANGWTTLKWLAFVQVALGCARFLLRPWILKRRENR